MCENLVSKERLKCPHLPIGSLASSIVIGTPSCSKTLINTTAGEYTPQSNTVPAQSRMTAFILPWYMRIFRYSVLGFARSEPLGDDSKKILINSLKHAIRPTAPKLRYFFLVQHGSFQFLYFGIPF